MTQADDMVSTGGPTGPKSPSRPKLAVISGFFPGRRLNSHVNHSAYCRRHGFPYIDASHPGRDPRPHFRKLEVILEYLPYFDWVFWIDDDAYFTDFSTSLLDLLGDAKDFHLVICRSPSTKRAFTKFSSGQFFLRNSPHSMAFIAAALAVDLPRIKAEFWREDLGMFTWGEQDALVYLSETDPRFRDGFIRIDGHNAFNNRDFEYHTSLQEHFLVHFTGSAKQEALEEFCARLRTNEFLLPGEELAALNLGAANDAPGPSFRRALASLFSNAVRSRWAR